MANYSFTEDQSQAILSAVVIVQDMADPENSSRPTLTGTFIRELSRIQALIETSNAAKAEKYLEKVSETLNIAGFNDLELKQNFEIIEKAFAAQVKEVEDKHEETDAKLSELPIEWQKGQLEALLNAGFKTALDSREAPSEEIAKVILLDALKIRLLKEDVLTALQKMAKKAEPVDIIKI